MAKLKGPIALSYIGPVIRPGEGVPLPEGWPAIDHEEASEEVATAKLASGMYRTGAPTAESEV